MCVYVCGVCACVRAYVRVCGVVKRGGGAIVSSSKKLYSIYPAVKWGPVILKNNG